MRKAVIFAVCHSLAVGVHGKQPDDPIDSLMMSFTRSMRGIEKDLSTGTGVSARGHADALSGAARDVEFSKFGVEPGVGRPTFVRHLEAIDEIAQRLGDFAGDGNLLSARDELINLRRTCVSCHVLFGGDSYGYYPSEGNILTGVVEILKLNGERRLDRSNAVVFVDRVVSDTLLQSGPTKRRFSQRNRAFRPRVLPVVKGTAVEFPNDDTIFHNVFSLSRTLPFDLDIYPPGESKEVVFSSTGWVKVYCNIHPNMIGHILVLDNSFFCLTD